MISDKHAYPFSFSSSLFFNIEPPSYLFLKSTTIIVQLLYNYYCIISIANYLFLKSTMYLIFKEFYQL